MNHDYRNDNWMYPVREPVVPTLDEIMLADELRQRLELRLLPATDRSTRQFTAIECAWADAYEV